MSSIKVGRCLEGSKTYDKIWPIKNFTSFTLSVTPHQEVVSISVRVWLEKITESIGWRRSLSVFPGRAGLQSLGEQETAVQEVSKLQPVTRCVQLQRECHCSQEAWHPQRPCQIGQPEGQGVCEQRGSGHT